VNGRARHKILVVAVGNPDRADDGVGALVGARLAGRLPPDTALIVRTGDILGLIEDWADSDALICIDAAEPMGAPGRIRRIDGATEDLPGGCSRASSHAFGLAEAIALARELRLLPEVVIVYAVEGGCFDAGALMTPAVDEAAFEVAERVASEVRQLTVAVADA
jgi:hydrogenase maturation protease